MLSASLHSLLALPSHPRIYVSLAGQRAAIPLAPLTNSADRAALGLHRGCPGCADVCPKEPAPGIKLPICVPSRLAAKSGYTEFVGLNSSDPFRCYTQETVIPIESLMWVIAPGWCSGAAAVQLSAGDWAGGLSADGRAAEPARSEPGRNYQSLKRRSPA